MLDVSLLNPVEKSKFAWYLFLPAILFCITASAQKKITAEPLTVNVVNVTLSELLETIAQKSGIPFSYNPKKIQAEQKVNYKATNKPLRLILDDLQEQFGLKYTLVENQIILQPEKKIHKKVIETFTLSGNVKDKNSGEALIGSTVFVRELQTGTNTNSFGFFSITVPKGTYTVVSSFVGYKEFVKTYNLTASIKEDIPLLEEPPLLNEITITDALPSLMDQIQTGKINIRTSTVEQRPAFFGEMDVVKSLEAVPGIKLHSDGSTFYYVRGGNRDQNLVLVDDAPVYNPSHMLGLFSTIIPDAVNDIEVYKGDMPAAFGGRLSSLLNVHTRKGNDQHRQISGSTGLISTKLTAEGPIKKDASSYFVSGRVSNLQWLIQMADKNIKQFNFFDLTGKINFKFGANNRIFFSSYTGGDNYFNKNNGIEWNNTAATLRWNHLLSDKLFLNTTLAFSNYDYFLHTDLATHAKWNSHISNINLKSDFSYFTKPESEFTFGWSITGYNFNPGNLKSDLPTPSIPALSIKNSVEFVLYGNHEVKFGKHWSANYGVRLSSWNTVGESFEFIFDEDRNPIDTLYFKKGDRYKKYLNAEPRLTLSYSIGERSSIKTSMSHNVQNVHLISNSVSPFTSLEVWLPSSINIKPQTSNQITLGYYHTLSPSKIIFTAEAYYKKMANQIDYNAHAETLLNPLLERELRFGKATAYGLELLAKRDEGRVHGWVGYTYSRSKRKFADINQGQSYNAFSDRPHQLNLMLAYDLSSHWILGMNWIYASGAPYSSPTGFYQYNGEEVPVYGQKNNDRLPDYHRLDLSATIKLNKNPEKKFQHSLSFSIFNIYGRKNALFINYNKTETTDGTFKVPSNLINTNRTTSQFYLFRFTPSFSYNFKF